MIRLCKAEVRGSNPLEAVAATGGTPTFIKGTGHLGDR
jgi:hypothetical protein